jgi:hypothetical protein
MDHAAPGNERLSRAPDKVGQLCEPLGSQSPVPQERSQQQGIISSPWPSCTCKPFNPPPIEHCSRSRGITHLRLNTSTTRKSYLHERIDYVALIPQDTYNTKIVGCICECFLPNVFATLHRAGVLWSSKDMSRMNCIYE